jgi:hypothetical protein
MASTGGSRLSIKGRVEKLEALSIARELKNMTDEELIGRVKAICARFIENPSEIDGLNPRDRELVLRCTGLGQETEKMRWDSKNG